MRRSIGLAWVAAAFVASAAGCGPGSGPIQVAIPARASASHVAEVASGATLEDLPHEPPRGASAVDAAIVWIADEKAPLGIRSLWIEAGSSRPRGSVWIGASRDEPVAIVNGALHAIRIVEREVDLEGCIDCENCKEGELVRVMMRSLVAQELGGDHVIPIAEQDRMTNATDAETNFELKGLFGSVAFIEAHSASTECGAFHPFFTDAPLAFDLATAGEAKIASSKRQIDDAAADARVRLADMRASCIEDPDPFTPALHALVVGFGRGASPRVVYTFTAEAPYMCGTGPGHYSVATEVERHELPDTHPPVDVAPWLTNVIGREGAIGIASRIPAARRDALRDAFRAPIR